MAQLSEFLTPADLQKISNLQVLARLRRQYLASTICTSGTIFLFRKTFVCCPEAIQTRLDLVHTKTTLGVTFDDVRCVKSGSCATKY